MPARGVLRFDTPARVRDQPAGAPFYDAWHRTIDRLLPASTKVSGPGRYVDPSTRAVSVVAERTYAWTGFPRPLLVEHRDDRRAAFVAGEERGVQIEYLEWHVERQGDRISRVTFSTETPEYWSLLARHDPERVLALYRRLVGPQVQRADLFPDGRTYDPGNRWTSTDGIVHYVMPINSMRDLLGVSQEAEPSGRALDGYDALPYSRATGADARINEDIWTLTRAGHAVATDDIPGLYILGWDDTGWTAPDGSPVGDNWRIVRGRRGRALRVVYEVPPSAGYLVGDIRIGGRRVEFGGQLAEHVTVSAHGIVGTVAS
jgi:hypothetical protein